MPIFQLQAKDAVVRINAVAALNCLQSFSWDSALNAENLSQLGEANYDAQHISPEVSAQFEARSTGSLSAMLSRMIYKTNASTGEFEGPLGTANTTLIRELDLERAVFDLIESKKANEVFDRSTLIPRAHLRSFSISARTDGTASESYSVDADLLEIFRKPFHDLIALPVVRNTAGTPATQVILPISYDVELSSTVATAEWKVYALDIDNVRVPASDLTLTTDDVAGDVLTIAGASAAAGVTIPLGAKLALILYKKVPGAFPTIEYPTTARFVVADQIDIWLVDPAATFNVSSNTRTVEAHLAAGVDFNEIPFTAAQQLLRVQSFDLSVDLRREALRQIAKTTTGNSIYARSATYPLNISTSFSVNETTLDEWARLQGKELYGADATPDILNLEDFENKEWIIVARYYKKGLTLQTVGCLNARIENPGMRISVGGKSEMSYSMTGSKFACQGKAI